MGVHVTYWKKFGKYENILAFYKNPVTYRREAVAQYHFKAMSFGKHNTSIDSGRNEYILNI